MSDRDARWLAEVGAGLAGLLTGTAARGYHLPVGAILPGREPRVVSHDG
jgi:hypothetical protein